MDVTPLPDVTVLLAVVVRGESYAVNVADDLPFGIRSKEGIAAALADIIDIATGKVVAAVTA